MAILTVDNLIEDRETEKSWRIEIGVTQAWLAKSLFEQIDELEFRPLTGFAKSLVKKIEAAA